MPILLSGRDDPDQTPAFFPSGLTDMPCFICGVGVDEELLIVRFFSLVLEVKLWVDELGKGDLYGQCMLL